MDMTASTERELRRIAEHNFVPTLCEPRYAVLHYYLLELGMIDFITINGTRYVYATEEGRAFLAESSTLKVIV